MNVDKSCKRVVETKRAQCVLKSYVKRKNERDIWNREKMLIKVCTEDYSVEFYKNDEFESVFEKMDAATLRLDYTWRETKDKLVIDIGKMLYIFTEMEEGESEKINNCYFALHLFSSF